MGNAINDHPMCRGGWSYPPALSRDGPLRYNDLDTACVDRIAAINAGGYADPPLRDDPDDFMVGNAVNDHTACRGEWGDPPAPYRDARQRGQRGHGAAGNVDTIVLKARAMA